MVSIATGSYSTLSNTDDTTKFLSILNDVPVANRAMRGEQNHFWALEWVDESSKVARLRTAVDAGLKRRYLSFDGSQLNTHNADFSDTSAHWIVTAGAGDAVQLAWQNDPTLELGMAAGALTCSAGGTGVSWRVQPAGASAELFGSRTPAGQKGWSWCTKCAVIFHTAYPSPCAGGGIHECHDQMYQLTLNNPHTQGTPFRYCGKCSGLIGVPYYLNGLQDDLDWNQNPWHVATSLIDMGRGISPACPNHSDGTAFHAVDGANSYVIPDVSAQNQTLYGAGIPVSECLHCKGLFWVEGTAQKCPSTGGAHEATQMRGILPQALPASTASQIFRAESSSPFPTIPEDIYQRMNAAAGPTTNGMDIRAFYAKPGIMPGLLADLYTDIASEFTRNNRQITPDEQAALDQIRIEIDAVARMISNISGVKDGLAIDAVNKISELSAVINFLNSEPDLAKRESEFAWLEILFSIISAGMGIVLYSPIGEGIAEATKKAIEGAFEIGAASTNYALEPGEEAPEGGNEQALTLAELFDSLPEALARQADSLDDARAALLGDWGKIRLASSLDYLGLSAEGDGSFPQIQRETVINGIKVWAWQVLLPTQYAVLAMYRPFPADHEDPNTSSILINGLTYPKFDQALRDGFPANPSEALITTLNTTDRIDFSMVAKRALIETEGAGKNSTWIFFDHETGQELLTEPLMHILFDAQQLGLNPALVHAAAGGWDGLIKRRGIIGTKAFQGPDGFFFFYYDDPWHA